MVSLPSCSTLPSRVAFIYTILLIYVLSINITFGGCFNSIISFGDSYADTGNLLPFVPRSTIFPSKVPPYGETYFHHPTGRFSNGRIIIDFIARHFGLSFVPPYYGFNNETKKHFGEGVNFAVGGATALDYNFLAERGIYNPTVTTISLANEIVWFKEMMAYAFLSSSERNNYFQNALVIMGEIGGNDIVFAFAQGKTNEEVESLIVPIINTITLAINEVIELGALTIMVPGNIPIGCLTDLLTRYTGSDEKDYDPSTGCINWLNDLVKQFNHLLQTQLNKIREMYPHVTIIYADYYNAAMQFYTSPAKYGFTNTLSACCGSGGQYNYNPTLSCGLPPTTTCENPTQNVNWDGIHLTEEAYKLIANSLLEGHYTSPRIDQMCIINSFANS